MVTGSGRACLATGMLVVVVVVVCEWPFGPPSTMAGPNLVLDSARRASPLGPHGDWLRPKQARGAHCCTARHGMATGLTSFKRQVMRAQTL